LLLAHGSVRVVFGGSGEVQHGGKRQRDRMPADVADAFRGSCQIQKRDQRRGMALAAVAAHAAFAVRKAQSRPVARLEVFVTEGAGVMTGATIAFDDEGTHGYQTLLSLRLPGRSTGSAS